jgi:hypothetical protein
MYKFLNWHYNPPPPLPGVPAPGWSLSRTWAAHYSMRVCCSRAAACVEASWRTSWNAWDGSRSSTAPWRPSLGRIFATPQRLTATSSGRRPTLCTWQRRPTWSGGTRSSACGRALRPEGGEVSPASSRRRGGQLDEGEAALVTEAKEDEAVEAGVADVAADGGGRGP